jgi:hypothetical protein
MIIEKDVSNFEIERIGSAKIRHHPEFRDID